MNTIHITSQDTTITESCHIYDDGTLAVVNIDIGAGITVQYFFTATESGSAEPFYRHISIHENSHYTGTAIIIDTVDLHITAEIVGDHATSTLSILALASNNSRISVEGVAKVAKAYRQVSTRVDQTNILIGTGSRVRGVPRLEIATEDIEGGHSCRMHRLGGEALFYLTSRGLTEQHAETLLLNSEILRHLATIEESDREKTCHMIHTELLAKK